MLAVPPADSRGSAVCETWRWVGGGTAVIVVHFVLGTRWHSWGVSDSGRCLPGPPTSEWMKKVGPQSQVWVRVPAPLSTSWVITPHLSLSAASSSYSVAVPTPPQACVWGYGPRCVGSSLGRGWCGSPVSAQ